MNNLDLKEFKIEQSESNENGDRIYYLKAKSYKPVCPTCESSIYHIHDNTRREVRDISSKGHRVDLIIDGHRYKCLNCGRVYSEVYEEIDTKSRLTNRLRRQIEKDCFEKPFLKIAEEYFLSEATIRKVFTACIQKYNNGRNYTVPAVLGIYEAHLNKSVHVVFTDMENGIVLEIIPKCSKKDVIEFIKSITDYDQIKTVTLDMNCLYHEAVKNSLPHAKIIINKFKVIEILNKVLDEFRKDYKAKLSKTERNQLTHERSILLKNNEELTELELNKLTVWFSKFPSLETAYGLKENFRGIYLSNNRIQAVQAYSLWKLSIPGNMDKFLKASEMIDKLHEEIFNYFDYPYSDAYIEDFDNLIKYIENEGYRNPIEVLRAKLLFNTLDINKSQLQPSDQYNSFGVSVVQLLATIEIKNI